MEDSIDYSSKKVCVLNFALVVTPGGGVLCGTTAQEKAIQKLANWFWINTEIMTESIWTGFTEKGNKVLCQKLINT